MTVLAAPRDGEEISVLTDVQREFLRRGRAGLFTEPEHVYDWIPGFIEGENGDDTAPDIVVFRWRGGGDAVLELSDIPDFSRLWPETGPARPVRGDEYVSAATNLMIGTRYYWRVRCGSVTSETRTFVTRDEGLRPILLRGVPNVRDVGGRTTEDGRRIRQGLLFRGQGLTDDEGRPRLTAQSRSTFFDALGVRTDLDLRADGTAAFADGEPRRPEYVRAPLDPYDVMPTDANRESFRLIFDVLSDPGNYPVYVHCAAGADRTGTLALFLEGLLGLPDGEIILDYDLSTLSGECDRNWFENELIANIVAYLRSNYAGETLAELCRAHAAALGIPQSRVDGFCSIMTE